MAGTRDVPWRSRHVPRQVIRTAARDSLSPVPTATTDSPSPPASWWSRRRSPPASAWRTGSPVPGRRLAGQVTDAAREQERTLAALQEALARLGVTPLTVSVDALDARARRAIASARLVISVGRRRHPPRHLALGDRGRPARRQLRAALERGLSDDRPAREPGPHPGADRERRPAAAAGRPPRGRARREGCCPRRSTTSSSRTSSRRRPAAIACTSAAGRKSTAAPGCGSRRRWARRRGSALRAARSCRSPTAGSSSAPASSTACSGRGATLESGFVEPGQQLVVESAMEAGWLFVDGARMATRFPFGARATFRVARQPLRLFADPARWAPPA